MYLESDGKEATYEQADAVGVVGHALEHTDLPQGRQRETVRLLIVQDHLEQHGETNHDGRKDQLGGHFRMRPADRRHRGPPAPPSLLRPVAQTRTRQPLPHPDSFDDYASTIPLLACN